MPVFTDLNAFRFNWFSAFTFIFSAPLNWGFTVWNGQVFFHVVLQSCRFLANWTGLAHSWREAQRICQYLPKNLTYDLSGNGSLCFLEWFPSSWTPQWSCLDNINKVYRACLWQGKQKWGCLITVWGFRGVWTAQFTSHFISWFWYQATIIYLLHALNFWTNVLLKQYILWLDAHLKSPGLL